MVSPLTFDPVSPNETRPLLLQQHEALVSISHCHEEKHYEPEPDAAEELQTLLALVYPVVRKKRNGMEAGRL
jgi:hypothetical protein